MMNVSVSGPTKRRLLAAVVESICAPHAAFVWSRAAEKARARDQLNKVQRTIALRICSACRTVSKEAVLVVAGLPPLSLLMEERVTKFYGASNKEARELLMEKWQEH